MTYYYVAVVGGDILTSSPHLDRVMHTLDEWEKMFPKYMHEHKVQILCYKASGEIIEWKPYNTKNHSTHTK